MLMKLAAQGIQQVLAVLRHNCPCPALRLALPAQSMQPARQRRRRISLRCRVSAVQLCREATKRIHAHK